MLAADKQTDVLVMELSKAFDKVGHGRLLHKLGHYGIRGRTHTCIRGFLSGRTHEVMVEGQHSDRVPVTSWEPQGKYQGDIRNIQKECQYSYGRAWEKKG